MDYGDYREETEDVTDEEQSSSPGDGEKSYEEDDDVFNKDVALAPSPPSLIGAETSPIPPSRCALPEKGAKRRPEVPDVRPGGCEL